MRSWAGFRKAILFIAGLLGFLHETFAKGERPWLLAFFAGMIGLPFVSSIESILNRLEKADKEKPGDS